MKRYLTVIIAGICIIWLGVNYNQDRTNQLTQNSNSTINNHNNDFITFSDPYLEQAIREKTSKITGKIYESDLENITVLEITSANIKDLSGIENLSNLEELDLSWNDIRDISSMSNLTNLVKLNLAYNDIHDIRSLNNLKNLTQLNISHTLIEDITPLSNLSDLTILNISRCEHIDYTNINMLGGLSNLTDSFPPFEMIYYSSLSCLIYYFSD
ncbi:leucine-rich repeat domain-containing protein [Tissierella praeacuta]|uniref:leucine-rich repeat domain-containing protein n=1 Tax=Tissierella praeacuta TaxID=43131 RepID=UPI00333ED30F